MSLRLCVPRLLGGAVLAWGPFLSSELKETMVGVISEHRRSVRGVWFTPRGPGGLGRQCDERVPLEREGWPGGHGHTVTGVILEVGLLLQDAQGRGCLPPCAGGCTGVCGCRGSQPFPGQPALDGTPQQRFRLEPHPESSGAAVTPEPGPYVSETAGRKVPADSVWGGPCLGLRWRLPRVLPGGGQGAPWVCFTRTLMPLVRAPSTAESAPALPPTPSHGVRASRGGWGKRTPGLRLPSRSGSHGDAVGRRGERPGLQAGPESQRVSSGQRGVRVATGRAWSDAESSGGRPRPAARTRCRRHLHFDSGPPDPEPQLVCSERLPVWSFPQTSVLPLSPHPLNAPRRPMGVPVRRDTAGVPPRSPSPCQAPAPPGCSAQGSRRHVLLL